MKIYEVLIEYTSSSLDRPFYYVYKGNKNIEKLTRVMVPFNNNLVCGFVLNVIEEDITPSDYEKRTGYILKEIHSVLDETP